MYWSLNPKLWDPKPVHTPTFRHQLLIYFEVTSDQYSVEAHD